MLRAYGPAPSAEVVKGFSPSLRQSLAGAKNIKRRMPVFRPGYGHGIRKAPPSGGKGRMERYRHVFDRFATFENLYDGYLLARRHKRYREAVLQYSAHLEDNLIDSVNRLRSHEYRTGPMKEFYEHYPKTRLIFSLPFYDRVINCGAYNVLWPIYSRSMYRHSYGSIPGRGAQAAAAQLQHWMRMVEHKPGKWVIGKLDIAKFFYRVPAEVQLRELGRPLDDPDMMWFLETAIRADGRPLGLPEDVTDVSSAERIPGRGMQTGSLISQMTANVVLTPLDYFLKRKLRVPYVIRYMDDTIFMCETKSQAWDIIDASGEFLRRRFGLDLNSKTAVMPFDHGVEFVGCRIWPHKVQMRRVTSLRMRQHLKYVRERYAAGELSVEHCRSVIASYNGLMRGVDCNALRARILEDFVLVRHSGATQEGMMARC